MNDEFEALEADENGVGTSEEGSADLLRDRGVDETKIAQRDAKFVGERLFIDCDGRYLTCIECIDDHHTERRRRKVRKKE